MSKSNSSRPLSIAHVGMSIICKQISKYILYYQHYMALCWALLRTKNINSGMLSEQEAHLSQMIKKPAFEAASESTILRGAQGALAPGLPPTEGLPVNRSYIISC